MFKVRMIVLSSVALVLTACIATTAEYKKRVQELVGTHVDHLVMQIGPPDKTHKMTNGDTMYEYVRTGTRTGGGYTYTTPKTTTHSGTAYGSGGYGSYSGTSTTYVTETTPTYTVNLHCRTRFIIDAEGWVKSGTFRGNSCKTKPR